MLKEKQVWLKNKNKTNLFTLHVLMAPPCVKIHIESLLWHMRSAFLSSRRFLTLLSDHCSGRALNSGRSLKPKFSETTLLGAHCLGNHVYLQTQKSFTQIQVKYCLFDETLLEFLSLSPLEIHYLCPNIYLWQLLSSALTKMWVLWGLAIFTILTSLVHSI